MYIIVPYATRSFTKKYKSLNLNPTFVILCALREYTVYTTVCYARMLSYALVCSRMLSYARMLVLVY